MKLFFTSQSSKSLAYDRNKFITPQLEQQIRDKAPDFIIPQSTPEVPKIICEYHPICKARHFGRINCLTKSTVQGCPSYKFYERYGIEYLNNLGVGAAG